MSEENTEFNKKRQTKKNDTIKARIGVTLVLHYIQKQVNGLATLYSHHQKVYHRKSFMLRAEGNTERLHLCKR